MAGDESHNHNIIVRRFVGIKCVGLRDYLHFSEKRNKNRLAWLLYSNDHVYVLMTTTFDGTGFEAEIHSLSKI